LAHFGFGRCLLTLGLKSQIASAGSDRRPAEPASYTPIEETTTPGTGDIEKQTNRFRTGTTYDDAGQVVTDSKFRNMNFVYDGNGRQVSVHSLNSPNSPDSKTVYDASGNRVATKINDVWQYMVYDAFGKLVAEYGVASEGVGGVKYLQQDWQGSVRTVANNNGFVVGRTDHQAFGNDVGYGVGQRSVEQGYSVGKVSRQGYGLTENDQGSGQQHTWFRKLETSAGRWSSPDPYKGSMSLGDPQSFNRYSYVENQPTNFVDPSGLQWRLECTWSWLVSSDGSYSDWSGGCDSVYWPNDWRWQGYTGPDRPGIFDPGAGTTYDKITPKKGQDNHEGRCNALKKSIEGHAFQAERHLNNYGGDFAKWVHPVWGNYLTGQLTDYQKHVDLVRSETMEYMMNCNDQGPPPRVPVFADVPKSIREAGKKSVSERIWDAVPSLPPFPTQKQVEDYYKKYPPLVPVPVRRVPIPRW
jgi:RHS repeat-associated protein